MRYRLLYVILSPFTLCLIDYVIFIAIIYILLPFTLCNLFNGFFLYRSTARTVLDSLGHFRTSWHSMGQYGTVTVRSITTETGRRFI